MAITERQAVEKHFDDIASRYDYWKRRNSYYYDTIKDFVSRIIPPASSVLEVGCGTGEILDTVRPARGVGIDISEKMVALAAQKYPQYTFIHSPIESLRLDEQFDYIIMVDVVDHVYDIMEVFASLYRFCKPTTQIILTTVNPWWDPILMLMEKIGAKMPEGPHNFIEKGNLTKILELMDFSVSYSGYMLLFPKKIPFLSFLANSIGTRIWGIKKFSAVQYMLIQPRVKNDIDLGMGCSVIIPCHNEADNIEEAVRRIPRMGKKTEIVVVNDGSTDNTAQKVRDLQKEIPELRLIDYNSNRGKGHAVRRGFEEATQEILMILDADISTLPEELPRFFHPLNKGVCQFVNGTRMVYPMENQAMRMLNLLGNKIFGFMISFITQQSLTDTLCGTKALYKSDFKRIRWGLDKWGDFDLLFGAAKMGSKIMEVPVHYMSRKSGESKMKAFKHGLHLLRACYLGFKELVFVRSREVPG
ncbi:MAG: glycosyltransferase [Candidatus Omnitrophica bacterium]|nr:glycosyltransferase [Candidatus Omnitrophota bacterium]